MTHILLFIIVNIILKGFAFEFNNMVNLKSNNAFDLQMYENVLDPVLCREQLAYLRNNNTLLLAAFMDAGIRIPKGILTGNFRDMGNYYQCLGINKRIHSYSVIEGKYCSISVPLNSSYSLPMLTNSSVIPWRDADSNVFPLKKELLNRLLISEEMKESLDFLKQKVVTRSKASNKPQELLFNLAICLPKVCTTREAISGLLFNTTSIDFVFKDNFCRLPNDKPWMPADYAATVIFSIIGVLTVLSTSYDLYHNVLRKADARQINRLLVAFSVYTNARRLVTYEPVPGALECLDGIRVIAMLWVVVGHTVLLYLADFLANPLYTYEWLLSWKSLWITAAPITVDTFFTLSGLLVMYTTAGKFTGMQLLKNLHLFYLNRLLRMFPILATFVLAQASFLNRIADGPNWNTVVANTNGCRANWWTTLLYIQNFLKFNNTCLHHTWYLAVDMQLYLISPIVVFWVLNVRKRYSWAALFVPLSCAIISASIYNIKMRFPPGPIVPSRLSEMSYYMLHYYINPLTRSPPFFIGMAYGYILHVNRNKSVILSKLQVAILWILTIMIMGTTIYSTYPILQMDWNNQTVDTLMNCFMKPAWALAIGWLVFACTHGYSGPINWFLSLRMWKVPSRLSYAMYIVHYPLLFVVNSTAVAPVYFTVPFSIIKCINILALTMIMSFIAVVFIDAPCSVLLKRFTGAGSQGPQNQSMRNGLPITQSMRGSRNKSFIPDT